MEQGLNRAGLKSLTEQPFNDYYRVSNVDNAADFILKEVLKCKTALDLPRSLDAI